MVVNHDNPRTTWAYRGGYGVDVGSGEEEMTRIIDWMLSSDFGLTVTVLAVIALWVGGAALSLAALLWRRK